MEPDAASNCLLTALVGGAAAQDGERLGGGATTDAPAEHGGGALEEQATSRPAAVHAPPYSGVRPDGCCRKVSAAWRAWREKYEQAGPSHIPQTPRSVAHTPGCRTCPPWLC